MIALLLAVPELDQEPELVRAARDHGLRIVRRCVDAAELLAAAQTEPGAPVVVSAGLPRLTPGLLDQLAAGRAVLGLAEGGESLLALTRLGVSPVVQVAPDPGRTLADVRARLTDLAPPTATGVEQRRESAHVTLGSVVAVWGPPGAPGRTTVAVGLADALARRGLRVCLADVDTYAPSVALALGVRHDASGLVAACRLAELGALAGPALERLTVEIRPGLRVLTGIAEPDRWSDVRAGALDRVWSVLRGHFDVCVVDAGSCLEAPDDVAWSRTRNGAERSAVASADRVMVVADASALGAARLVRGWPDLTGVALGPIEVVRNRVRGSGSRDPQPARRAWVQALRAMGVDAPVHDLPADPRVAARAWSHGRTIGELARRSRLCHALDRLTEIAVTG